jgi:predicted transposase/invertase (TIGR01784 family)
VLLDPKLDVVFKILFTLPENRRLLLDMLTAVLNPPSPIKTITILNPGLPKEFKLDKGGEFDIHLEVELEDQAKLDIEMDSRLRTGLVRKIMYYWARAYTGDLKKGQPHAILVPTISIVWLNDTLTADPQLHSVFRVLEQTTYTRFSSDLEIHLIELPKLKRSQEKNVELDPGPVATKLRRWVEFFSAKTEEELEKLTQEDMIMREAKDALERISNLPEWCNAAAMRQRAIDGYWIEMTAAREEGEAKGKIEGKIEGRTEGRTEGKTEGEAKALLKVLEKRFGSVNPSLHERIMKADLSNIEKWLDCAIDASTLEQVFGSSML